MARPSDDIIAIESFGSWAHDGDDRVFLVPDPRRSHEPAIAAVGAEPIEVAPTSTRWRTLAATVMGESPKSRKVVGLIDEAEGRAFSEGTKVEVHTWSAHDGDGLLVAVGGGNLFRLGGKSPRHWCHNDPRSGKLILSPPGFDPVDLDHLMSVEGEYAREGYAPVEIPILRRRLLDQLPPSPLGGLDRVEVAALVFAFLVGVLLTHVRARPILCFFGPPASGKTVTARILLQVLLGPDHDVSGGIAGGRAAKDLVASQAAAPFVVRDDLNDAKAEVLDVLCRAATGGKVSLATFHKTLALSEFTVKSSLVITAYRPGWATRDDVLSRLLPVRLMKPVPSSETDQAREARLLRHRVPIWLELLEVLDAALRSPRTGTAITRFADWESIVGGAADHAGLGAAFDSALRKLPGERVAVVCASDYFLAALVAVARDPNVCGKPLTAVQLCAAIENTTHGYAGMVLEPKPRSLARSLSRIERDGSAVVEVTRATTKAKGGRLRWVVRPKG